MLFGTISAQNNRSEVGVAITKSDAVIIALDLYESGQTDVALDQLRMIAVLSDDEKIAAKSRKAILDHYWKVDDYEKYIAAASSLPERIEGYDEGQADLRCGYIFIRQYGDLESAKKSFEKCGKAKGDLSKEAKAASKWVDLLARSKEKSVTGESLAGDFSALMTVTQGALEKDISAADVARRTYQYAIFIKDSDPDASLKLMRSISQDPIFGIFGIRAKSELQISGASVDNITQDQLLQEEKVFSLMKEARKNRVNGNVELAFSQIEEILNSYSDCDLACEARLTKAYMKLNSNDLEGAEKAFANAIKGNAHLPADHPFNLEAKARLAKTRQRILYTSEEKARTIDQAGETLEAYSNYIASMPQNYPGEEQALLDASGSLFEVIQRKVWSNTEVSDKEWKDLINSLSNVKNHPTASIKTQMTSGLMLIEVEAWRHNYLFVIQKGERFLREYSDYEIEYRKQFGTVLAILITAYQLNNSINESIETGSRLFMLYNDVEPVEIWEGMAHLQKAYYDTYVAMKIAGQDSKAAQLLGELERRFPESKMILPLKNNSDEYYKDLGEYYSKIGEVK